MILVNGKKLKVEHFPDGTQKLNLNHNGTITWVYDNDEELFTLISVIKHMKRRIGNPSHYPYLQMPFAPNARFDRTYSDDEVFTLKYFCEIINDLKLAGVKIEDPHSNVITGLLDRVDVTYDFEQVVLDELNNKDDIILFFPDNGAASKYTKFYSYPYAYGLKHRDWKTGEIKGLEVVANGLDIKDKKVIIVDDICSRGGTFYYSAKALKELGVGDITLCVTHCENSVLDGEMIKSDLISKIITTDSVFTGEHEKIEVKRWYRGEKDEEN